MACGPTKVALLGISGRKREYSARAGLALFEPIAISGVPVFSASSGTGHPLMLVITIASKSVLLRAGAGHANREHLLPPLSGQSDC